jgi:hypothetical protein
MHTKRETEMPKYTVALYRMVVLEQIAEVAVEAASEAEARLIAAERVEEVEFGAAQKAEECVRGRWVPWSLHHHNTLLYRAQVHEPDSA